MSRVIVERLRRRKCKRVFSVPKTHLTTMLGPPHVLLALSEVALFLIALCVRLVLFLTIITITITIIILFCYLFQNITSQDVEFDASRLSAISLPILIRWEVVAVAATLYCLRGLGLTL